jgi:hypothetical protein
VKLGEACTPDWSLAASYMLAGVGSLRCLQSRLSVGHEIGQWLNQLTKSAAVILFKWTISVYPTRWGWHCSTLVPVDMTIDGHRLCGLGMLPTL